MKDVYKRIMVGVIVLVIVACLFALIVELAKRTGVYKYLTYEDTWGESKNCYIQSNQKSLCEIDNNVVSVKQYYEVE